MRNAFRTLYRQARRDKLTGRDLHLAAMAITGEPAEIGRNFRSCLLYIAVERAIAPTADMRKELRRTVLNGWGSKYGLRAPSMTSPRFEAWNRIAHRASRLSERLRMAGRLELDAGDWATGEILPAPTADKAEISLRDALGKLALTYQHVLWMDGKDPLQSRGLHDAWRALGTQPDTRFLIRKAA